MSKFRDDQSSAPMRTCEKCDPPEPVKRALRSAIGAYRHMHYLEFHSTADLEKHIRGCIARFPAPERGYDYDNWLQGVLVWHAQKQRWRAEDQRNGLEIPDPAEYFQACDEILSGRKERWQVEEERKLRRAQSGKQLTKTDCERTWDLNVNEMKTPDQFEELARACLDGSKLEAIMAVVCMWRKQGTIHDVVRAVKA